MVKNLPAEQETWVQLRVGKIPWRREWLATLVVLPGECHGQRSLAGYSPWGHKEPDTTEHLTLSFLLSHGGPALIDASDPYTVSSLPTVNPGAFPGHGDQDEEQRTLRWE